MALNPFLGKVDTQTVHRTRDLMTAALRPARVQLVNRLGIDVPLELIRCELIQLGHLRSRLMEEQVRLFARVTIAPFGSPILMGMDNGLLSRLVGMLLGENPHDEPTQVVNRPFTPTDLKLAGRILDDFVVGLEEGLPRIHGKPRLTIEKVTDDPYLDLTVPDTTGMVDMTVRVGPEENPLGTAVISFPSALSAALMPAPQADAKAVRGQPDGMQRVLPLPVEGVAELCRVTMTLRQLQSLQVGDTIPLRRPRTIEMRVKGKVALVAQPGSSVDGIRCIKVEQNMQQLSGPTTTALKRRTR